MNPVVKILRFCERRAASVFQLFIELIIECFIRTWHLCVRVYHLPLSVIYRAELKEEKTDENVSAEENISEVLLLPYLQHENSSKKSENSAEASCVVIQDELGHSIDFFDHIDHLSLEPPLIINQEKVPLENKKINDEVEMKAEKHNAKEIEMKAEKHNAKEIEMKAEKHNAKEIEIKAEKLNAKEIELLNNVPLKSTNKNMTGKEDVKHSENPRNERSSLKHPKEIDELPRTSSVSTPTAADICVTSDADRNVRKGRKYLKSKCDKILKKFRKKKKDENEVFKENNSPLPSPGAKKKTTVRAGLEQIEDHLETSANAQYLNEHDLHETKSQQTDLRYESLLKATDTERHGRSEYLDDGSRRSLKYINNRGELRSAHYMSAPTERADNKWSIRRFVRNVKASDEYMEAKSDKIIHKSPKRKKKEASKGDEAPHLSSEYKTERTIVEKQKSEKFEKEENNENKMCEGNKSALRVTTFDPIIYGRCSRCVGRNAIINSKGTSPKIDDRSRGLKSPEENLSKLSELFRPTGKWEKVLDDYRSFSHVLEGSVSENMYHKDYHSKLDESNHCTVNSDEIVPLIPDGDKNEDTSTNGRDEEEMSDTSDKMGFVAVPSTKCCYPRIEQESSTSSVEVISKENEKPLTSLKVNQSTGFGPLPANTLKRSTQIGSNKRWKHLKNRFKTLKGFWN